MHELKDIVATTEEQSEFLGHIFWFSVSGKIMIESKELEEMLTDSGVGKEWMPNPIRPADAFRRATREVQKLKRPTSTAGVFENFLLREVYSDDDIVQRNIVIERVDQKDKKLGYETESAILTLDRENVTLSFETNDERLKGLCLEAKKKFDLYKSHYSGQHVRVMINRILKSLAPTPLRKNGTIYFVPRSKDVELGNLVNFIQSLEESEGYQVPVVDSEKNEQMVSQNLKNHLTRLKEQCKNSEGLKKGQLKALIEETNEAIQNYREYKELVTSEQESIENEVLSLRSEVMHVVKIYQEV